MDNKIKSTIDEKYINVKELTFAQLKALNKLYLAVIEADKAKDKTK